MGGTNVLALPPGAHGLPAEWNCQTFTVGLSYTERRAQILSNIKEIRAQIEFAETSEQKTVFETAIAMEVSALKKLNEEQESESTTVRVQKDIDIEACADKTENGAHTEIKIQVRE